MNKIFFSTLICNINSHLIRRTILEFRKTVCSDELQCYSKVNFLNTSGDISVCMYVKHLIYNDCNSGDMIALSHHTIKA